MDFTADGPTLEGKEVTEKELTSPPNAKRPRLAPPKPTVSFQHPVSELVSKHQGAIFNFSGKDNVPESV